MWILLFEGCHTREDALNLTNYFVKIPSSERVPLPSGHYYIDQIIGLDVLTEAGLNLGQVKNILKTGSNDVYVVDNNGNGREILIPALKSVVKKIDLQKGYILIELPAGLLDDT